MKKEQVIPMNLFIFIIFLNIVVSDTIYVDHILSENCTGSNYSILNRDSQGSDGSAYKTIQEAVDAMQGGDDIFIRGGTYKENVTLHNSKDGTDDNWSSIQSFPKEWAIIDGQHKERHTLGRGDIGRSAGQFLHFWRLERLEIMGGGIINESGGTGGGICISGYPLIVRYCSIHDNVVENADENPAGIRGYGWKNSKIEYCYFKNNGCLKSVNTSNGAHIALFADYDHSNIAQNGYNPSTVAEEPNAKNEICYNFFDEGVVGFKHKSGQLFSGRNPDAGHGWDDTYANWGDKIHHNYWKNLKQAIYSEQDFSQIYNNIIDSCRTGIVVQYQPSYSMYKVVTYNNTILNSGDAITRWGTDHWVDKLGINEPLDHYGWDFNNIFVNCTGYNGWCQTYALNVIPFNPNSEWACIFNLKNYYCENNYFYNNPSNYISQTQGNKYTVEEFKSQTVTSTINTIYSNTSTDELFEGNKLPDKYITRGEHEISDSNLLAVSGYSKNHPYLKSVTIPKYIGATDPNNNSWIGSVLNLIHLATDSSVLPITNKKVKNGRSQTKILSMYGSNIKRTFIINLKSNQKFTMMIYSVNGKKIWKFKNTGLGMKKVHWNEQIQSGLYIAELRQGRSQVSHTFVIAK